MARGWDDDHVLQKANEEDRILITNDKDFGDMVFRERKPHKGVILLRPEEENSSNKIHVLQTLLEGFAGQLGGNFVVASDVAVRVVYLRE